MVIQWVTTAILWTEVLEADAFEPFKQKGIFDKETADKLKKYVYSAGNTDDLMTQYVRYRGSEPKIEPLLGKKRFRRVLRLPIHTPYKNGEGGVKVGLEPIKESDWLEIDDLFNSEIELKRGTL